MDVMEAPVAVDEVNVLQVALENQLKSFSKVVKSTGNKSTVDPIMSKLAERDQRVSFPTMLGSSINFHIVTINNILKQNAVIAAGRLDYKYNHVYLWSKTSVAELLCKSISVKSNPVIGYSTTIVPTKIMLTRAVSDISPKQIIDALSKYATVESKIQIIKVYGSKEVLSFRRTVFVTMKGKWFFKDS